MTGRELAIEKNKLRAKCKKLRLEITGEQRVQYDSQIFSSLVNSMVFGWAQNILMYCPDKGEAGFDGLFEECIKLGKNMYFPRCLDDGVMEFRKVSDLSELSVGKYGIYEPSELLPIYEYDETQPTLCLVPSLCVDRRGYRIGYGKGYYDRFVKSCKQAVLCAVQYEKMVFDEIVFDKRHDKRVDMILTEKGVYVLGQTKG